ncbi:ATP-binding protein [Actinomadura rupiterrae]|uniref:ATP-binding protein n=1 Tax=Actinomadura rupiterrae TaxID=559627 RepID=UPI0020A56772|nr:LuxR C-terminal-related transcriptional regulator [Actinomadura rupiterrae]MCP2341429.1 non-specific serine/threonine protein kinase [Actinomadura rupiterrae]
MTQRSADVTQWGWVRPVARHESTAFVGRAAELEAVARAVTRARVITLTGPGGVGKTRIALRAAQQLDGEFPDGVSIAELSGLRDPEFLPNTVASAVGLPENAAQHPMDQLLEYFADRRALLVLDTCEHLVEALAVFADILVSHSAGLVLMLTSRQPVALPGECVLQIPPMPRPGAGADETTSDTVALFVARAQAARPSFVLCADNRAEVIAVCRRLDGIPLAIELAAVRLRTMPLDQILRRLDDRFQALAGARLAQARHKTLRATIEWSHDLCTEDERELWARLSVFAGGFTLAAVEEVCAGAELAGLDVVDLLMSLVDKSVVQCGDGVAEARYHLLDSIREYGAERLEEDGRVELYARRHQEFFARMAVRAGQEWFGDHQVEWGDRLAADIDNFRVAMDFAAAHPGDEAVLRMVNGLWGLWQGKSRLTEGRRWIDKALDAESAPTIEHGKAVWLSAYYGTLQSAPDSREMVRRCRTVAEHLDDDFLRARAAAAEAFAMIIWGGDVASTMDAYRAAREQLRARHDLFPLAVGYSQTSAFLAGHGEPARALREVEEGLRELAHIPQERWVRNYLLIMQVLCLWATGELDRARELSETLLLSALEQGETMGVAAVVEYLSWIAADKDEDELAATLLGGAGALWRQVGTRLWGEEGLIGLHTAIENRLMLKLGGERFTQTYGRGAALPLDQLINLAGGHAPHPSSAAVPAARTEDGSPLGPLTPREREVARLVAEGLTNRQIAECLVISKRTADAHVEHILSKLGFNSRVQVAAMLSSVKEDQPS